MKRGALIVVEGCDRAGKTTQCKKLIDALKLQGKPVELVKFPDRTTVIGKVIDSYLEQSTELQDNAIHLLFSANRWERVPYMQKQLNEGKTIIVDRYAYSGVAFTAAKQGFDLHWCKQSDVGLLKPDIVLFLDVNLKEAELRADFGKERYESTDFQKKVRKNFFKLKDSNWKLLDASQSIDDLHRHVLSAVNGTLTRELQTPMEKLWI